jgi:3-methyladenine DNA glycosylase AlkD
MKNYELFIASVNKFLPYVSNWSVCDTICNKNLFKYKSLLINEVYSWLKSEEVYRVRYAVKCLMNYYLDEDFKEEHIKALKTIKQDDYYVKMMVAWYLATGLAKQYDAFIKPIENKTFDAFTHNKAIQKAVESYRVSDEHKAYLKTLKIKGD